jgi:hypothetical protein
MTPASQVSGAWLRLATAGTIALAALCATGNDASARERKGAGREAYVQSRVAGPPVMAIVSLGRQRVTVYDADGWIMRAPVSSGRPGYETPAGVYSILQRKVEHYSNLYDDAEMPFMQRLTWSGIALHAGPLPGYPASHGCVRMPHGFAERLFDVTRLGMRVIVMRDDIAPADISHPVLFKPASGEPGHMALAASGVASDAPQWPVAPLQDLRKVAAAKAVEAEEAARRADAARLAAQAKYKEATQANKALRIARNAKLRAEAHLRRAEGRVGSAAAEDAKAKAQARLADAEARLTAVEAEVKPVLDGVEEVREAARAAHQAKLAAREEAREAKRKIAPVSIFISRETQRLYVRQSMEPMFESPVTIADPDKPLGTYVFAALAYTNEETDLRWTAVSLYDGVPAARRGSAAQEADGTDIARVKAALDRISIPADARARISAVISPGSSLIVSDEALSKETGAATEFVVIMSGEPQGGIKMRRREPEVRHRYQRYFRSGPYGWGPSFW